jgi:hypothetical protein
MDRAFAIAARDAYVRANEGTLTWMLERPRLRGAFLNTKQNSLTLRDYEESDFWRSPGVLYGWIQGRGLEALVRHAGLFARERPALAERLNEAARALYHALADLYRRFGRAYFSYDADLNPIYPGPDGAALPQRPADGLATYSDIFVLKGLTAASIQFEPAATAHYLARIGELVGAIEDGRFVINERQPLQAEILAHQADEYGPHMIMLGAASLLDELGFTEEAAFGTRFVHHILDRHVEDGSRGLRPGTIRDTPAGDHCNPGHGIEFAGFALEVLPVDADPALVSLLEQVLLTSFELGFAPPGILLRVSLSGKAPPNPYRPWWSLPEAMRAAARAFMRTGNPASSRVWQTAHEAFFDNYWRRDPPIAYQTLADTGPVDFVPATPDLDPGYHTGLSFLGAIEVIDSLLSGRP